MCETFSWEAKDAEKQEKIRKQELIEDLKGLISDAIPVISNLNDLYPEMEYADELDTAVKSMFGWYKKLVREYECEIAQKLEINDEQEDDFHSNVSDAFYPLQQID